MPEQNVKNILYHMINLKNNLVSIRFVINIYVTHKTILQTLGEKSSWTYLNYMTLKL